MTVFNCKTASKRIGSVAIGALSLLFALAYSKASTADECDGFGADDYLCGIPSAEDLVQVPESHWIIASGFALPPALSLIDSRNKVWEPLYSNTRNRADHDEEQFSECPGAPDPTTLLTHGLDIISHGNGHSTLYAVGHGGREAIEVFDVYIAGPDSKPALTWIGCVLTPDGLEANSVAALRDGSLLATVPLEEGQNFAAAMQGTVTGAAYHWSAKEGSWNRLDTTAQPYANGIAVSADESEFYIASSGLANVTAYKLGEAMDAMWSTATLPVVPDNLHRNSEGQLITAGMVLEYPDCNPYNEQGEVELALFASCPRPYKVLSLDPDSQAVSVVASNTASPVFSNVTMAVVVDGTLWVGTFGGDRIAYRSVGEAVK
ncbi:SMP-30/gluconolactonase/LRE family protein [Congregibacter brevis]|uniref:SMP-30/gluconolactonase/LRE family protein n=1 Tax=Congregibacter brevis TaxID=3081201 RepID=A0ABZ0I9K8_9GAMM|nr:SMP-30/gluconolactonase/LRE family protein [Congregibacter sp. IMCC45268]